MGIMLNEDCNHFLYTRKNIINQIDEDYLKGFIDQYANTTVTDFVMNIAATLSFVPSKTRQFAADKYLVKTELGKPVDYTDTELSLAYNLWYEKKLDMYKIWIDRCYEKGINSWLSFRMNDAELTNIPNHILSEYYYEHFKDYARIRHREPLSPLDLCRDYEIEDFRNYQLIYIEEMLDRYDVYGIELDFQREIYCFKIGHEWDGREIMTEFMQDVKNIVIEASKKRGHDIKVSVRCHAHPEDCLEMGFDVAEWAKRGLVDVIIPSPNWLTSDNGMPIKLWKQLLDPYGVDVVGCIDRNLNSNEAYLPIAMKDYQEYGLRRHSYETLCASAVNIMSQAPGNIYLFNCMDCPDTAEQRQKNWFFSPEEYKKILGTVGDLEKIIDLPRRHVVTYNDTVLPWKKCNTVFPVVFDENRYFRHIKIDTGKIPEDFVCKVRLGIQTTQEPEVYINSVKCEYIGKEECEAPVLTESTLMCFEVPKNALQKQTQIVEIVTSNTIIDYADLIFIPSPC